MRGEEGEGVCVRVCVRGYLISPGTFDLTGSDGREGSPSMHAFVAVSGSVREGIVSD